MRYKQYILASNTYNFKGKQVIRLPYAAMVTENYVRSRLKENLQDSINDVNVYEHEYNYRNESERVAFFVSERSELFNYDLVADISRNYTWHFYGKRNALKTHGTLMELIAKAVGWSKK